MRIKNSIISAVLLLGAGLLTFTSCSKDKYTSKPQLKFKKASSYDVERGGIIELFVEFTDKEGDISDSIWIRSQTTDCTESNFEQSYKIGDFPASSNFKGEFKFTFENGTNNLQLPIFTSGRCFGRRDTTTIYFWVRDKKGNVSDTISTDKPLIL
jgi:hypothetical protein